MPKPPPPSPPSPPSPPHRPHHPNRPHRFAHTSPTLCRYRSHPHCPCREVFSHRPTAPTALSASPTLPPLYALIKVGYTPPPPTTSPPTVPIAHTALTLATPSQCFAHSLHGFRPHCPHQPECPNPSSSGFPEAEHGVSPNTSPHHAGLELELPQMLAADWTCNQHS